MGKCCKFAYFIGRIRNCHKCQFDAAKVFAEASGTPTSSFDLSMEKNKRKYIRIEKEDQWEMIDRLLTIDEYKKSFNKLISDALDFGLPLLVKCRFDNEEQIDESAHKTKLVRKINGVDENTYNIIVKLLKEVILNVTINKSILCSLFETKNIELSGERVNRKKYKEGAYRDTPEYLINYEIKGLNELRK